MGFSLTIFLCVSFLAFYISTLLYISIHNSDTFTVVISLFGKRHIFTVRDINITELENEDDRFLFIHAELKICAKLRKPSTKVQAIQFRNLEVLGQLSLDIYVN